MYNNNYIQYKPSDKQIGVIPIALVVKGAISILPAIIPWISNAFKHPARDAIKIIDNIKPQLASSQPRERLGLVLAAAQKISPDARDVMAEKLFVWYRLNYPNDYQSLLPEDKEYYNNFLANGIRTQPPGNNFYADSQRAMFTNEEINYNATPVQAASNILTNVTKSTSSLLLYLGIGLGLFLILKKKK
jgi:hypothetical protein